MPPALIPALWMLGAVLIFVGMALSVRELSHGMGVLQILFLRVAVGLPILLGAMLAFGGIASLQQVRSSNLGMHVVRNLFQMAGQGTWIFAVGALPFAMVFAIEYSQPLFAVLFGSLILREHPNRWQQAGLALGFCGVVIIVRPGEAGISWAALIMLAGSASYGLNYMVTRVLARTDKPVANPFWSCVMQIPASLALLFLFGGWQPITWEQVPYIVIVAAGGIGAQHCVATALTMAPLARVIPIDYLRLPIIAAIGALFYAEAIDPLMAAGAAIVIAGVVLTQRKAPASQEAKSPPAP